jgi:MFS family permease
MLTRSLMCYLLCGTRLFQQSMRNTLTNVLVLIALETPISTSQKGSMLAMIPLGYFLTQVPGGALADKLGAKNVMTAAMGLSALCCLVLPTMFDTFGMPGMLCTLATMGAVQGPLFPTSSVFLAAWMPTSKPGEPDEKAWGTSMLDIGISVGTLAIIPTVTFLSESVGWRHTYHVVGGASMAFVVLWQMLAASSPAESKIISKQELEYLEKNVAKKSKAGGKAGASAKLQNSFIGMPWAVALHPGLWAVFLAHMAFNFGAYYLTNWSPTYYKDVLGVAPKDAYIHLMVPHITNLLVKSSNPSIVA